MPKLTTNLLLVFLISSLTYGEEIFPEPDIIKSNVKFWKMIYSEISINEGVLHDRDYPLIVYEKSISPEFPKREIPACGVKEKHYISLVKTFCPFCHQ